ncbi:hypothetical protein CEE89_02165, partial [Lactobacillus crispatus]
PKSLSSELLNKQSLAINHTYSCLWNWGLKVLACLTIGLENIRKTGIMSLSNRKDALPVTKEKQKSRKELEKEIQQLKEENLRLRIVNEYVKKLSALDQEDQKK